MGKPTARVYVDGFNLYHRALKGTKGKWLDLEQFTVHNVRMALSDPGAIPRTVEVIKTEEKGSDVNLASHLLLDACQSRADFYAIATNDSDLAEPIRMVKKELGKPVGILYPSDRLSKVLLGCQPDLVRQIRRGSVSASQFPDVVKFSDGRSVCKPEEWA
ncbi:NYN domain-containing protein [Sinomonas sp. JGH33]|uniref:NYN domain-containing protein n=1 Tax=Sinomonas terricola TaxID=3110330 RepID=A0ABU5T7I1_9MICC|nr:NYN domain-containing protein [Sinomonas sp. JGH33]MEA5455643.1 NYN domain-containing protein [Sinomonas sp. JGH33]